MTAIVAVAASAVQWRKRPSCHVSGHQEQFQLLLLLYLNKQIGEPSFFLAQLIVFT